LSLVVLLSMASPLYASYSLLIKQSMQLITGFCQIICRL
jgi:hypothetical protein